MPEQEVFVDTAFPTNGVDTSHSFSVPLPQTTPVGINTRTFEALTGRGRGGMRPGLGKFIPAQVPAGTHLIQHLNFVVDPDASALLDQNYPGGTVDPSNLGRGRGRLIRPGGWGIAPNRNFKLTPVINWSNPANISVGTALSGTQLNATATDPNTSAPVAGSFVYSPASGTHLGIGNSQPLNTIFTPTDTTTYNSVADTVFINVTGGLAFIEQSDLATFPGGFETDVAFPSSVSTGNLLVGVVFDHGVANAYSCADTLGNTYSQIGPIARTFVTSSGNTVVAVTLFYCFSGSSGACTMQVTGSTQLIDVLSVQRYSGASSVGNSSTNSADLNNGIGATTGTITVSSPSQGIIAAFYGWAFNNGLIPAQGWTFAGSFTTRYPTVPSGFWDNAVAADDLNVSSNMNVAASTDSRAGYVALGVAFKP